MNAIFSKVQTLEKEEQLASEKRAEGVVWMRQTIGNACGTVGIIHALLNSPVTFQAGSVICK